MKQLIITADDFGAADEINEAVESAHRQGVLTAASLMVGAPALDNAVRRARETPTLRVGLHLTLTDGRPVLPAAEVAALVGPDGRFNDDMVGAAIAMTFNPAARRQLAAEITAQFEAFAATGLTLDHVNAHRHFHMHPVIGRLILRIGARFGLRSIRVPCEPRRVLALAEPEHPPARDRVVGVAASFARSRFRAAGLLVPDQVFGLAWSGAMTGARLAAIIQRLPEGLSEIYLHPATSGGFEGAAPGYRYAEEFVGLMSAPAAQAVEDAVASRGGFSDFLPEDGRLSGVAA